MTAVRKTPAGLGIRPAAVPAWTALHRALAEVGSVSCAADPDAWGDPAAETAGYVAGLCRRCPINPQCHAFAEANNETAGIWAGIDRTPRVGRPPVAQPKEKKPA